MMRADVYRRQLGGRTSLRALFQDFLPTLLCEATCRAQLMSDATGVFFLFIFQCAL